jgi:mycofactocin precursor
MAPVDVLEPVLAPATATQITTQVEDDFADLVEDELLIEEISIDGMCGVY